MANGTLKVSNIQTSSGSGTITLGQSGETVTIPSGCTISNSGTASGFGGITMAQQWRLSSNFTCNGNDQTITGWEAADQAGSVNIGSAMTESSGVFTFPQTGIYEITQTIVFGSSDYSDTNVSVVMQLSTNSGGAYTTQSVLWIGYESGAGGNPPSRQTSNQSILMDVTDVSTDRFRTRGSNADSTNAYFEGNSSSNYTMLLFKRLGDT